MDKVERESSKVASNTGQRLRKENMLKFLTHKLRTHSINEDNYVEKVRIRHVEVRFVIFLTSLKVIRVKNGCAFGSPEQRNVRSGPDFRHLPAGPAARKPLERLSTAPRCVSRKKIAVASGRI